MSKKLENKIIIVTGGSKGIGAGIAKQMGKEGSKVVVNYISSKTDADNVVTDIINNGGTAMAVQGDMSKSTDVKRLFEETHKAYGDLDVLVNNAGIYEYAPLEGLTEDAYRRMFDINVLSLLLTSQEAIKTFGAKGGSIINISSVTSEKPEPYSLLYSATKSAVDSITTSLSQELGHRKIRVNSIRPGGILTEGAAKLGLTVEKDSVKKMISRTALGRIGTPDDVAKVAVFLASDDAYFVTGEKIDVSGGFK